MVIFYESIIFFYILFSLFWVSIVEIEKFVDRLDSNNDFLLFIWSLLVCKFWKNPDFIVVSFVNEFKLLFYLNNEVVWFELFILSVFIKFENKDCLFYGC